MVLLFENQRTMHVGLNFTLEIPQNLKEKKQRKMRKWCEFKAHRNSFQDIPRTKFSYTAIIERNIRQRIYTHVEQN